MTAGSYGGGYLGVEMQATIVVACDVPDGCKVSTGGSAVGLPAKAAGKNYTTTLWGTVGVAQDRGALNPDGVTETPVHFTGHIDAYLQDAFNNILDHQQIVVDVTAKMKYNGAGSASITYTYGSPVYFTLKNGGVDATHSRVINPSTPPSSPTPEDWDVITDEPDYKTDDQGRVIDLPPVPYDINGNTGNWPPGSNHSIVTAPQGSTLPSWAPPGSKLIGGDGHNTVVHVNRPGFEGGVGGGNVTYFPDGSAQAWVYPVGNPAWGNNYYFPPGVVGKKNGMPPTTAPSSNPLDPCFSAAATDLNLPGGSGSPTAPPDGGIAGRPDPTLPGLPPGIGTDPGPGGGSGGSGGGTGGAGGSVGHTGSFVPLPTGPGASGPAPGSGGSGGSGGSTTDPSAGIPLPGDGDANKYADDMTRAYAKSVASVQGSASGFSTFANIVPFSPGIAGDWVISLPISGHTYLMTIPTAHASTVRAILLLLVRCVYIAGIFKLIIS